MRSYTKRWFSNAPRIDKRVTYFYENHVVPGASAHYAGKIMTASIVWDAINDILVGGIVDKRRHEPYRKMRPYLLYLPPVIGEALYIVVILFVKDNRARQEEIERLLKQKRRENTENRFSVKNTESEAGE